MVPPTVMASGPTLLSRPVTVMVVGPGPADDGAAPEVEDDVVGAEVTGVVGEVVLGGAVSDVLEGAVALEDGGDPAVEDDGPGTEDLEDKDDGDDGGTVTMGQCARIRASDSVRSAFGERSVSSARR